MCPPAISLDQLATLPVVYRVVIPPDYEDRNGHMNMRWYLALYDEAGDAMYPMLALTADYFQESGMGGFDLEHHLWYLAEVRIGDTVVIRVRFVAERQADALFDVHGERNTGRALLDLRVRSRACRSQSPSHRHLPGSCGGQDRRPDHSAHAHRRGLRRSHGPWGFRQALRGTAHLAERASGPCPGQATRSVDSLPRSRHRFVARPRFPRPVERAGWHRPRPGRAAARGSRRVRPARLEVHARHVGIMPWFGVDLDLSIHQVDNPAHGDAASGIGRELLVPIAIEGRP